MTHDEMLESLGANLPGGSDHKRGRRLDELREELAQNKNERRELCDELGEAIDWRESGHLSPVKEQGKCGCCYSFVALTILETRMRIMGYDVPKLSE